MTKTTKTIHTAHDIHGYDKLRAEDQKLILTYLANRAVVLPPAVSMDAALLTASPGAIGLAALQRSDNCLAPPAQPGSLSSDGRARDLETLDAHGIAAKLGGLGPAFKDIATLVLECGVDGKYILSRTPAEFDEILTDLGVNDATTGRQKRRRICFELGLC